MVECRNGVLCRLYKSCFDRLRGRFFCFNKSIIHVQIRRVRRRFDRLNGLNCYRLLEGQQSKLTIEIA